MLPCRLSHISIFYVFVVISIGYTETAIYTAYFQEQKDKHVTSTPETTRYFVRSRFECAGYCSNTTECCKTSFVKSNRECIVDNSIGCTAPVDGMVGAILFEKRLDCASGWHERNGRCILYSSTPMSFQSAESFCHSNGGRLVTIESSEKNTWLFSVVQHYSFQYGLIVGAQRTGSNSFIWEDGNGNQLSMPFINWNTGEPNGLYRTCDCIRFLKRNAKWDDMKCSAQEPVICENIQ